MPADLISDKSKKKVKEAVALMDRARNILYDVERSSKSIMNNDQFQAMMTSTGNLEEDAGLLERAFK
jgi:hypothetical protein